MLRLFFLLTALCTSNIVLAQSDFRKGYIITLENDTINGLIDYRDGTKNFETCSFKKNENDEIVDYRPSKLNGYRFKDDKYFKPRRIENQDGYQEYAFLEVLISGSVSLYKHKSTFFIEKGDSSFHKLETETIETFSNGEKKQRVSKKYLGILSFLLSDCSELRKEIQSVGLSEGPLMKIVKKYHKLQNLEYSIYRAKQPTLKLSIGIYTGVNISNTKFSSERNNFNHLVEGNFENGTPIIGLNFNLFFPRFSGKISFLTGFSYLSQDYFSSHKVVKSPITEINDVSMQIKQLKIPFGFQYTFTKRKFTPYINLGLSTIINIQSSASWIQDSENNNVVVTKEENPLALKSTQIGFWGGLGVSKAISPKLDAFFELRYELTNTESNFEDGFININGNSSFFSADQYTSTSTNIQFSIGINY